jgi:hypothetical protein
MAASGPKEAVDVSSLPFFGQPIHIHGTTGPGCRPKLSAPFLSDRCGNDHVLW